MSSSITHSTTTTFQNYSNYFLEARPTGVQRGEEWCITVFDVRRLGQIYKAGTHDTCVVPKMYSMPAQDEYARAYTSRLSKPTCALYRNLPKWRGVAVPISGVSQPSRHWARVSLTHAAVERVIGHQTHAGKLLPMISPPGTVRYGRQSDGVSP